MFQSKSLTWEVELSGGERAKRASLVEELNSLTSIRNLTSLISVV